MDYNNIINDDGFYLYKDDSFNTLFLQMAFLREKGNFEDAVFGLLCKYLTKTNKNYKTEYDLNKKITDLYSIDFGLTPVNIGSQTLLFFSADLVSPKVIHDDYLKDAFKFINEILFEPDFTKEEVFENTKRIYLSFLLNTLSQSSTIARNIYEREVFNLEHEKFRYATDEDYIINMVNSVTLKDLEAMYKKTFKEDNFIRGIAFGNITDKDFKLFRENFKYKNNKGDLDYKTHYNFEEKEYEIVSDTTSESSIFITYSIDDIDEGVRKILCDIFNGSSDLCLEILREKYGLVYSSNVNISYTGKLLIVKAKIDKNNKQKLIEATDELISIIKDKNKLKELLETAKKSIKNDYYLLSEDRDGMIDKLDDYVSGIFDKFDDKKFVEEIDKVEVDDILKYTKTIKKKNVFMYRGDLHE